MLYDEKPGSPGDILEHHGVKGMKWGVRKKEDTPEREVVRKNEETKSQIKPGTPEFKERIQRITRTDHPQILRSQPDQGGRVREAPPQEKHGLSRNQKIALAFGAAGVAAAGYYAYTKYSGNKMPGLELSDAFKQKQQMLDEGLKLPANWDVSGLKHGPISKQRLGDLAGGEFNAKLKDAENLVINTSRGFADIMPKDGFDRPFAAKQHESVVRVLEEMRERFPAVRNMNIEVVPMSKVPGMEDSSALQSVLAMRAGEARVMYNDLIDEPSLADIRANATFLPGLGKKDYLVNHEMGHLLAAAHGELPPAFHLLGDNASPTAWRFRDTAEPLLHRKMFAKHGFTFTELSELSGYAASEPAEAMAELAGHYFTPQMRHRLTPDQIRRAEAMFNEMGGLT